MHVSVNPLSQVVPGIFDVAVAIDYINALKPRYNFVYMHA
jgi:hypothetical protein